MDDQTRLDLFDSLKREFEPVRDALQRIEALTVRLEVGAIHGRVGKTLTNTHLYLLIAVPVVFNSAILIAL